MRVIEAMEDDDESQHHGRSEGTRRSSRAVNKPNFRAMENYGSLQESDDLFFFDAEDAGGEKRSSGTSRGSGSKSMVGRQQKSSGKSKAGTKMRRPAALDDMESLAKKLEDDVAILQRDVESQRHTYETLCQENQVLMEQVQMLQHS